ncbi:zinc-ribbon domain-containing protein [Caldisericum exile]|uniref:zinc-ribbon domain-containing protein n=1 Tax=Caldisericum exile TaxID=693075 RepID=UPI003C72F99D
MKECPNCGYQNEDNAKICVNCGYYFDEIQKNFEWVLLKTCENEFEAEVLSNLLETNGIKTMMKRPGPMRSGGLVIDNIGANPFLGPTGNFDVFVMRVDLKEAKELMKAYESEDENGTNEDDNA